FRHRLNHRIILILKSIRRLRIGFIDLPILERSLTGSALLESLFISSVPSSPFSSTTPIFFERPLHFTKVKAFMRFVRLNYSTNSPSVVVRSKTFVSKVESRSSELPISKLVIVFELGFR
ncbi:hypothetical protein GIB67_008691, partial [Kingdonia uniflora]